MKNNSEYNGQLLIGVTYQLAPWIYVDNDVEHGLITFGPVKIMMDYLARAAKFRYDVVFTSHYDEGHGKKLADGNWTGIIGIVQREEADFALSAAGLNYDRHQDLTVTHAFASSEMGILSGFLNPKEAMGFSFLNSFTPEVWILFFVSLLVIAIVTSFYDKIDSVAQPGYKSAGITDFIWAYYGSVFYEPFTVPLNRIPAQLLSGLWLMCMLIVITLLTGTMRASLTVSSDDYKIDQVSDVTRFPEMKAHMLEGSVYAYYIQASEDKDFKNVWQKVTRDKSLVTMEEFKSQEVADRVSKRKSMLLMDRNIMLASVSSCTKGFGYHISAGNVMEFPLVLIFKKSVSSEFLEKINIELLRMYEGFHIERWLKQFTKNMDYCFPKATVNELKVLTVFDLQAAFVIWAEGLLLALVAYVIERLSVIRWKQFITKPALFRLKKSVEIV